jgi:hypothetical protein
VVAADVVFGPSGAVEHVALAHREQLGGTTTACVKGLLRAARVRAYVGKLERITVVVSLR